MTWSAQGLRSWLATHFRGESVIVLANREPCRHERAPDGSLVVQRSSGGLVTALEPLMEACSGVWVAHGAGSGDRMVVDRRDGCDVPSANPRYRLRRVWLSAEEEREYYFGFANEGLWPLCHRTDVAPIFRPGDFRTYAAVNARFAAAVCDETTSSSPVILVQDYHFALAPQLIRARRPTSVIVAFWHIPWPSPHLFVACPFGQELLEGLLGCSIVGFQTPDDVRRFLDTVEWMLGASVDRARGVITYGRSQIAVRTYPVSVEWPSRWASQAPSIADCRDSVGRMLGVPADLRLVVGVDRLDYTKGIPRKLLAIERLLETQAHLRGRVVFAQIAEPSRESLPAYHDLQCRVRSLADCINQRFGGDAYRPIVLLEQHYEPADVYRFLRAADVCYVNSLHDGMNLVAKEFVSARDDERGVLVLSEFAGASRELTAALTVNPYDVVSAAQALDDALRMPPAEQAARMRTLRGVVAERNAYRWAHAMLADVARLRTGHGTGSLREAIVINAATPGRVAFHTAALLDTSSTKKTTRSVGMSTVARTRSSWRAS